MREREHARIGRHRYGIVLALTLAMAVFNLTARNGPGARAVALLAAAATLVTAVVTSEAPPRTRRAVTYGLVVLALVGAAVVVRARPAPTADLAATALLCGATLAVIAGGLLRLVLEDGVVLEAVLGALAVYLLVGLVFAFLVGALATGLDGPYFAQDTDGTQSQRAYFSFTVLTTTGFGDLTAAAGAGRLLAVLEMLIGQLYLVTVIALLVGNLRRRR